MYRDLAHRTYSLNDNTLREIHVISNHGSKLSRSFWVAMTPREIHVTSNHGWKLFRSFWVAMTKEIKRIVKNVKKRKKIWRSCLTNNKLLITQDLLQAHYQIKLIILLKEFLKSNISMDMITKDIKRMELNTKILRDVLNT